MMKKHTQTSPVLSHTLSALWTGSPDCLTCPAFDELGFLVGATEGGHHDLVEAARCEGGEGALGCGAAEREGGEHLDVVEEQLHLVVVHVTEGRGPGHTQLLGALAG